VFKVFIDGKAGTTGLRLEQRLAGRGDIELIAIEEELRKDTEARVSCIAEADVAFLCLPDEGSVGIMGGVEAAMKKDGTGSPLEKCRIIDCSTAFRTKEGWAYGLPELSRNGGAASGGATGAGAIICEKDKRVANPGCHATGFIMSVRPLIEAGLLDPAADVCFHSLTGYSGGGKAMIAEYENNGKIGGETTAAPKQHGLINDGAARLYGLAQEHKHLPEMLMYSGLATPPVFSPIVCDFYSGMLTCVPLPRSALRRGASAEDVREALAAYYGGCPLVKVREAGYEFSEAAGAGFLSADAFAGRDDIEIFVTGKDDRIQIVSRYDNLGKGASGAAIQNMNILLGLPEETGLVTGA